MAEEVYDYGNLEQAYLEVTGYAYEEEVINLQNHLIWGSYQSDGSVTDKVVMKAIMNVLFPSYDIFKDTA
ncbi:MAG: hypothetical protein WCR33_05520 [Bacilli bacterium]